jgi:hypothetical protein
MNNIKATERELAAFFKDTSELAAMVQSDALDVVANGAAAIPGAQITGNFANKIEYWKWMGRNFKCLGSPDLIAQRGNSVGGAADWLKTQVQGKGYEWDYFNKLRNDPRNIFSRVELPDIPNQPGHDMAKMDINGKVTKYQNKAYVDTETLDLSNTPKDTVVVTNKERIDNAKAQGYKVKEYKDANEIVKDTNKRMDEAKGGKAGQYTVGGIAGVMAKAGAIGFVIGAGTEAIIQYRRYKSSEIDGKEYLKSITLAGGHSGITAAASAGIMIPIQTAIVTAGLAAPIAIPIGFVIGIGIDKFVAPILGRGDYATQFAQAKFYNNLNQFYGDLEGAFDNAGESFRFFVLNAIQQQQMFNNLQKQDMDLSANLKKLYDDI